MYSVDLTFFYCSRSWMGLPWCPLFLEFYCSGSIFCLRGTEAFLLRSNIRTTVECCMRVSIRVGFLPVNCVSVFTCFAAQGHPREAGIRSLLYPWWTDDGCWDGSGIQLMFCGNPSVLQRCSLHILCSILVSICWTESIFPQTFP